MKLVAGETSQAFMVITRHRERIQQKTIKGEYNATWLRSELCVNVCDLPVKSVGLPLDYSLG